MIWDDLLFFMDLSGVTIEIRDSEISHAQQLHIFRNRFRATATENGFGDNGHGENIIQIQLPAITRTVDAGIASYGDTLMRLGKL